MELIGKKSGFSLIEAAISVLVLATIGVFILQLLTAMSNAMKKVSDIDTASYMALAKVELYRAGVDSPNIICYDDNWNEIDVLPENARFVLHMEISNSSKPFEAVQSFNSGDASETIITYIEAGKILELHVSVIDNNIANDGKNVLVAYTTTHYEQGGVN